MSYDMLRHATFIALGEHFFPWDPWDGPEAAFVDMVCKPWEHTLEDQVQSWIDKTPLAH